MFRIIHDRIKCQRIKLTILYWFGYICCCNLLIFDIMKTVLANLALLFGIIGFIGYIFLIIASVFGCCAGLTTLVYHKLVLGVLALAVVIFILCMYNNCCKTRDKDN